jgi:Phosphotransferase enzyme family
VTRIGWAESPQKLRVAILAELANVGFGSVVGATSISGGFSPGMIEQLLLDDGRSVFVKASSSELNPVTPTLHLREALLIQQFPASIPHASWIATVNVAPWIGLITEFLPGGNPEVPVTQSSVGGMLDLVDRIAESKPISIAGLAPIGESRISSFWFGADQFRRANCLSILPTSAFGAALDAETRSWLVQHLVDVCDLERGFFEVAGGDHVIHGDLRADNVVATPDRGFVAVDWAWASLGSPLFDLVGVLPSLHLDGGPSPWEVISMSKVGRIATSADVRTLVAGISGYFMWASMQPPPPGIPTVRAFQASQARVCIAWLRKLGV